jgi:hypothetical protein
MKEGIAPLRIPENLKKEKMKIRSKVSLSGKILVRKGQMIDLPDHEAEHWVKNGYGEYVIPESGNEAAVIKKEERKRTAKIEKAVSDKLTEKAVQERNPVKEKKGKKK